VVSWWRFKFGFRDGRSRVRFKFPYPWAAVQLPLQVAAPADKVLYRRRFRRRRLGQKEPFSAIAHYCFILLVVCLEATTEGPVRLDTQAIRSTTRPTVSTSVSEAQSLQFTLESLEQSQLIDCARERSSRSPLSFLGDAHLTSLAAIIPTAGPGGIPSKFLSRHVAERLPTSCRKPCPSPRNSQQCMGQREGFHKSDRTKTSVL
jgi:hypothetical protein